MLTAFPLLQWLHERALLLRYKYIACLVMISVEKNTSIPLFIQWHANRLKPSGYVMHKQA